VDGFLAKRFGMTSQLGAYLDPLADKVLIVSIYISLGILDVLPRWLVILVVSRDLLIVGGVILSWVVGKPVGVKPHPCQRRTPPRSWCWSGWCWPRSAFNFDAGWTLTAIVVAVTGLTLLSVAFYLRRLVRHMGSNGVH